MVEVIRSTDGSFVTKGDANNTEDQNPTVPASQVVGRVALVIPFVGRLA